MGLDDDSFVGNCNDGRWVTIEPPKDAALLLVVVVVVTGDGVDTGSADTFA